MLFQAVFCVSEGYFGASVSLGFVGPEGCAGGLVVAPEDGSGVVGGGGVVVAFEVVGVVSGGGFVGFGGGLCEEWEEGFLLGWVGEVLVLEGLEGLDGREKVWQGGSGHVAADF